ncbi:hypothetical protein ACR34G_01480 [Mycoplasma sp. 480]|uniref:hypothetical protein n=1 Tax=Mycoplasma sp. 480 TaxID=3440155 RepID=UPI003F51ABEE
MTEKINKEFLSRYFNSIEKKNNLIYKSSADKNKILDEYYWFIKLPQNLKQFIPNIYLYQELNDFNTIVMDFVDFPNIYNYLQKEVYINNFYELIDKLFYVLKQFKDTSFLNPYENKDDSLSRFIYIEKTNNRINQINESEFVDINKKIIFNNKELKPFNQIKEKVFNLIEEKLINRELLSIVHGDFFFSNILFDEKTKEIKLVDPRGRFDYYRDVIGDLRYDLAKLSHSISGKYDWIVHNNFSFQENSNNFILKENFPFSDKENKEILLYFNKKIIEIFQISFDEIKLIEGLLFLTMIPLHKESKIHQKIFYLKSIEIFNDLLKSEGKWE